MDLASDDGVEATTLDSSTPDTEGKSSSIAYLNQESKDLAELFLEPNLLIA